MVFSDSNKQPAGGDAKRRRRRARILIWVKTYPQLSMNYKETVCTGGTLEDGRPVRLYPIPLRYLGSDKHFKKYQWISADIWRSSSDSRPESYRIDCDSITLEDTIPSTREWAGRSLHVFRSKHWVYNTMDELKAANASNRVSIGFVRPRDVYDFITEKNKESEDEFFTKYYKIHEKDRQSDLFYGEHRSELLKLRYVSERIRVKWHCHHPACIGHGSLLFDWEAYEFWRNHDDEQMLKNLFAVTDVRNKDVGFFLGNTLQHQTNFSIGGIWRPTRVPQQSLFDSVY